MTDRTAAGSIDERQLWSWIDRNAPELQEHLARHPEDQARVDRLRAVLSAVGSSDAIAGAALPDRFGPFVIRRVLGEGAMGVVYEAEREGSGEVVALKVLRPGLAQDGTLAARFRREAEALAGRLPYDVEGKSIPEIVRTICDRPPVPIESDDPSLAGDLADVLARALAKRPEHRYSTAADLSGDLRACLAGRAVRARVGRFGRLLRRFRGWIP